MATKTKIEWTQLTWNPITGCTKISAGCKNCYAERMAMRLQAMGVSRYQEAFKVTLHTDLLELPRKWKQPRLVFVNSMSDLFHEDVPTDFIERVFEVMASCPQHNFQILTKRSHRLRELAHLLPWEQNIWVGVTVENNSVSYRITDLQSIPAAIRFLSCEPLLEPINNLILTGIHWVIVGGESGPGARPMEPIWVESIYNQCLTTGVPFFFKQWGGTRKKQTGRKLYGRTFEQMPLRLMNNKQ